MADQHSTPHRLRTRHRAATALLALSVILAILSQPWWALLAVYIGWRVDA